MLDVDFARSHFPALDTPWALLDNAGGSACARTVVERAAEHMSRRPVQLGATYPLSVEAADHVREGKRAAATLVGAREYEVVIRSSSTVCAMVLAQALRPLWREGDEVVVTNLDHETNIGPWRRLEATGIAIKEWRFDPDTLALEVEDLEKLLTERTRLVAFTHCSNVVGTIHDVERIAAVVRAAGALSCVDGVAFAPHRRVDVKALGVDFYLMSLYKTYGPHLGLLYGRHELLGAAKGQNHFFVGEDEVPYKLEPGNVNYELTASLVGLLDYHEALDRRHGGGADSSWDERLGRTSALFAGHEELLVEPLLAYLSGRSDVRLVGASAADPLRRAPTVSFVVDGVDSSTVPPRLEASRLAVRYGHFYAYRAIRDLGLLPVNGVVRASLVHYNTADEVHRLVEALDDVRA